MELLLVDVILGPWEFIEDFERIILYIVVKGVHIWE